MQVYCESLTDYIRLKTTEVRIGDLLLGNGHPIRVQTMTTTDTMDTLATVEQSIRCIDAGSELVRITAPSIKEAQNLLNIKNELRKRGYTTPLVADIHFTPNAAEVAARIVEKVRINPGNYVDKKKFQQIEYTDTEYAEEIERIRERFTPLIKICKEYGTAMRIGTNHGSLSDRIMSRYGDTPMGMVESAMEFLRIARSESYHQIVLSMKSSNPQVMVQAYRLLTKTMQDEFGECYPLHLGVTEAGDGEDGRIKSAIGIGTLLEDGIGDTIRVSLTEDPEFEIPVCKNIVKRYQGTRDKEQGTRDKEQGTRDKAQGTRHKGQETFSLSKIHLHYSPFEYKRRETFAVDNIGGKQVPVVVADFSKHDHILPKDLESIGYTYDEATDKWNIGDAAADYIFCQSQPEFNLPGTLKVLLYHHRWVKSLDQTKCLPLFDAAQYLDVQLPKSDLQNFVMIDSGREDHDTETGKKLFAKLKHDKTAIICLSSTHINAMQDVRGLFMDLMNEGICNPVILICDGSKGTNEENLIHYAIETGALLLDGLGDGICLGHHYGNNKISPETEFLNAVAFGILQATRTRICKTEYISCPSCGRTLFDLQETTARIRAVTNHLKGVKIAIMGCIVNGPGEMADADFGYVGSGPGRITLYKGKEIVKRNISSEVAVEELISLIKENNAWQEVSKMTMKKNIWIILFLLTLLLNVAGFQLPVPVLETVTKPLLIPILLLYFIIQTQGKVSDMKQWIWLALFFSWAGDVLLMFQVKYPDFFLWGLIAFLIAHIFYIIFFYKLCKAEHTGFKYWLLIPVTAYYVVLISWIFPHLGKMQVPVAVYGFFISTMLLFALHSYFIGNKEAGKWMMAGAILFVVSDSSLAVNKFYQAFDLAGILIMVTYGLAQLFITMGAIKYLRQRK
jgi:(E)-4-hydroxy-3-methylbut-2-enyl-diphosphate synthase